MIEMFHVYKYRAKNQPVLEDINLKIEKGEFVFFVGASGAGKSMLLKLISCEERVDQGQIVVEGKNVSRLSPAQIPYFRRNFGFVFQDLNLIQRKTVYENITLPMEILGAAPDEMKRRVEEILKMFKLEPLRERRPATLSLGERQRVAIARAFVNRPAFLLADEPTGYLDESTSQEIVELFKNAHSSGATVMISTHRRDLLAKTSRRTIFLKQGRVISEGRPV